MLLKRLAVAAPGRHAKRKHAHLAIYGKARVRDGAARQVNDVRCRKTKRFVGVDGNRIRWLPQRWPLNVIDLIRARRVNEMANRMGIDTRKSGSFVRLSMVKCGIIIPNMPIPEFMAAAEDAISEKYGWTDPLSYTYPIVSDWVKLRKWSVNNGCYPIWLVTGAEFIKWFENKTGYPPPETAYDIWWIRGALGKVWVH